MGFFSWIGSAIKKDFNKPIRGRKRRPGEPQFNFAVTGFRSQNNNQSEGTSMPKVNVSSKVSPAGPAKRKKRLTKKQLKQIQVNQKMVEASVKDAEGKATEPEAQPKAKARPAPVTRQERAAQEQGMQSRYPVTAQEKAVIMRRQPRISPARFRISPVRPRIGR